MTISNTWFTRVKTGGVQFHCCFASPSASDREFEEFLNNLTKHVTERELFAIAGDLNAWARDCGILETDKRRYKLLKPFIT